MSHSKRPRALKRQRIPAASPNYIPMLKSAAKKIRAVFARFEAKNKVLAAQKKAAAAQAMKDLDTVAKVFGYDAYNGLAGAIAIRLSSADHGELRLPWKPKVPTKAAKARAAGPTIDVVSPKLRARLLELQEQLR